MKEREPPDTHTHTHTPFLIACEDPTLCVNTIYSRVGRVKVTHEHTVAHGEVTDRDWHLQPLSSETHDMCSKYLILLLAPLSTHSSAFYQLFTVERSFIRMLKDVKLQPHVSCTADNKGISSNAYNGGVSEMSIVTK